MQSVWTLLQSNMSLVMSLLVGLFTVLFNFGFELVNIVVSVCFLTVLYYLLATSKRQWKPLEWFSQMTPRAAMSPEERREKTLARGTSDSQQSTPIATAVEEAIKGVFILSFKKSLFYGLYIWFVHTLFDIHVVFMPSVFGSMLAAVPLTAPYWVSVPGILELWLIRGQGILACVFFVCHLLPMFFVDVELIKEVRGSHPYLTGLSIIGGLYWLGIGGVLIGPMVLCLCLVVFHLYRSMWSAESKIDDV